MMELVEKFGTNPDGDEGLKIRGFIRAVAVDARTGEVVAEREIRNTVTKEGFQLIAKQLTSDMSPAASESLKYADVGTDAGAFSSTVTNLLGRVTTGGAGAANARISVSGTTSATASSGCTAQYTWSYDTNQANNGGSVTLREVGLFNRSVGSIATDGGTMFARATFGDIAKNTDVQVSFSYQLRFQ